MSSLSSQVAFLIVAIKEARTPVASKYLGQEHVKPALDYCKHVDYMLLTLDADEKLMVAKAATKKLRKCGSVSDNKIDYESYAYRNDVAGSKNTISYLEDFAENSLNIKFEDEFVNSLVTNPFVSENAREYLLTTYTHLSSASNSSYHAGGNDYTHPDTIYDLIRLNSLQINTSPFLHSDKKL
ncbi:hypothetical protein AYI70_g8421 [Smittium culicis]|uniref:Uncharacterized protein n=1 Tax=Smittium culicis TaxID=133412 RepID=A0A1R1XG01_9FUNG|nr:hypothetical protein AYI70_g8421 [Smittium culicis]